MTTHEALHVLYEFNGRVDENYGLCLDAGVALPLFAKRIENRQTEQIRKYVYFPGYPTSMQEADARRFIYGKGHPDAADSLVQHVVTHRELKARNRKGGQNLHSLRRAFIILIYSWWEEEYRRRFAEKLSLDLKSVVADIFGDLRILRNAIVHNNGIATSDVEKRCRLCNWFRSSEEIALTEDHLVAIVREIRKASNCLCEQHCRIKGPFGKGKTAVGQSLL